jgi:type II secretory pathway component PulJ
MTSMAHNSLHSCAGICLAELMIALAAGMVVLAAAVQSLTHFERRFATQQEMISRQQDLRLGLAVMGEELRRTVITPSGASLSTADGQEVAFLSNLEGATAVLTEAAVSGQQELKATGGAEWSKGKRVMLCHLEQCAEGRLARDGQKKILSLDAPLPQSFPAGTAVWLTSQIRYYLGKDRFGRSTLMRQIDGGANPLIGEVSKVQFRYLDGEGNPTQEPTHVRRIHFEVGVGGDEQFTVKEVSLRTT